MTPKAIDIRTARRLFRAVPSHDHPARFSAELTQALVDPLIEFDVQSVLDPFSGTGLIHIIAELAGVPTSIGVELEPEWANIDIFDSLPRLQVVGNSCTALRTLPGFGLFGAIESSCTYASRMADKHQAKDPCKTCDGTGLGTPPPTGTGRCGRCRGTGRSRRNTYTHRLGRPLTNGNSGGMQWGEPYRELHKTVWAESVAALAPGGIFVLNVKDHIRKKKVVPVSAWHHDTLTGLGLAHVRTRDIACPGNRNGENADARVDHEHVMVFRKAA